VQLYHGDCLEVMATLPAASVDMILADPPYGTTACKWDSVIPFAPMWAAIERVIKPNGAVVLFGSQPFTSALVMSKPEWFKYSMVWNKRLAGNFLIAKVQPLKVHEDIDVFSQRGGAYYPQMRKGIRRTKGGGRSNLWSLSKTKTTNSDYHPLSILDIPNTERAPLHPTQKPVALLAYLIRTYTNKGETVLDFCMGSGSTGAACIEEGRDFIGIEKDAEYFEVARKRIEAEQVKPRTMRMEMI
jgi:DNA modification methylase